MSCTAYRPYIAYAGILARSLSIRNLFVLPTELYKM